jgi:hypothetical protein
VGSGPIPVDSGPIPADSGPIPADSGPIPADSGPFLRIPVIPAGICGAVRSTVSIYYLRICFKLKPYRVQERN